MSERKARNRKAKALAKAARRDSRLHSEVVGLYGRRFSDGAGNMLHVIEEVKLATNLNPRMGFTKGSVK